MEKRDLYNINKVKTGDTINKGDTVPDSLYYLIVVCFIQNNNGEFLMQKRVLKKDGKWATTGGHPKSGESSLEGIHTEILEELGSDVDINKLILFKEAQGKNSFCDLYYLKQEIDIDDIIIQKSEVEMVKWLSIEDIEALMNNNMFNKGHHMMFKDCLTFLEDK